MKQKILLCFAGVLLVAGFIYHAEGVVAIKALSVKIHGLIEHSAYTYYLTKYQRFLNEHVAIKIRELKSGANLPLLLSLLLLSFVYGVFHALGPGHGKSIISSWIVTQERRLADILTVSILAAVFHALSASLLVVGTYVLLGKFFTASTQKMNIYLQSGAAVLLIVIGLGILIQFVLACSRRSKKKTSTATPLPWDRPFVIALSIGAVPCPVTSVILIFCLTSGLFWQGFILVSSFATGMGLSILGVSLLIWKFEKQLTSQHSSAFRYVTGILLPILGGVFLILTGTVILLSS